VRIACLGAGPGGLLAALLAKRSDPGREVTVYERNRAGDTFGFGVVFSDATLDGLGALKPALILAALSDSEETSLRPYVPAGMVVGIEARG